MDMDISYIAGLFDGEGSIGIYITKGSKDSRYKKGYRGPSFIRSLNLGSCYLPTLKKIEKFFGVGRVAPHQRNDNAGNKQMYYWHVGARNDIELVLNKLLPHLHEKKNQAKVMLAAIRGEINEHAALEKLKLLKMETF